MGPSRAKKLRTVFKKFLNPAPSTEKIFTLPSCTLPSQYRSLLPARDTNAEEMLKLERINRRIRNVVVVLAATLIVFLVGIVSFLVVTIFNYIDAKEDHIASLSMKPSLIDHFSVVELLKSSRVKSQTYEVLASGSECVERCWEFSAFKFSATCERGRCRCHNKNYQRDTCLPVYGKCAVKLLQPVNLPASLKVLYKDQAQPVYICSSMSLSQDSVFTSTFPDGRRSDLGKLESDEIHDIQSFTKTPGGLDVKDIAEDATRSIVDDAKEGSVSTSGDSNTPRPTVSTSAIHPFKMSFQTKQISSSNDNTMAPVATSNPHETRFGHKTLVSATAQRLQSTSNPLERNGVMDGIPITDVDINTDPISTVVPRQTAPRSTSSHLTTSSPLLSSLRENLDIVSKSEQHNKKLMTLSPEEKPDKTEFTSRPPSEHTTKPIFRSSPSTDSTVPSTQQDNLDLNPELRSLSILAVEKSHVHVISVHSDRSFRNALTNVTVFSSQKQGRITIVLVSYGGRHWNLNVADSLEVEKIVLVSNHRVSSCSVSYSKGRKHEETNLITGNNTVPSPAHPSNTFSLSASPTVTRKLLRTGYGDDRRRGNTPQLLESITRIVGEIYSFIGVAQADSIVYNTEFVLT